MADTPDKPTTADKPATPRRRAPRKTPAKPAAAKTAAPKPAAPKTATAAAAAAPAAPARKASTPKPAKPRSTKRATPRPAPKKAPAAAPAKAKPTRKWGVAAIAGGVAALGAAATAALLSLRGSTPKSANPAKPDTDSGHNDGAGISGSTGMTPGSENS